MKKLLLVYACWLIFSQPVFSKDDSFPDGIERKTAMNIFLDCDFCDLDYIRSQFTIVNYVSEWDKADIMVQMSSITTGSGGEAYTMIISGRNAYNSVRDTIHFATSVNDTEDIVREVILKKIKLGLVSSLLKTPYGDKIDLLVDETPSLFQISTTDPWKSWAFEIYGSAAYSSQKTSENLSISGSVYASKITEKMKLQSVNSIGYTRSSLTFPVSDSVLYKIESCQKYLSSRNLAVFSLGGHGGIGGTAIYIKNDVSNLSSMVSVGPTFEYNLFDYADASRKQFRFLYSVTYEHSDYSDTTVYGKLSDDLFQQELNVIFTYLDRWGTLSMTAFANNYLNQLSQYSVGVSLRAGISLPKGILVSLTATCAYYQNQLSLRKGGGDINDLITGKYEMEKELSYNIYLGLTYRFGSIYNNVVNPRFER